MIKAMLDTNILIYLYKNHPPAVVERLKKFRRGEIVVSSIVWAEFSVGLHKLKVDGGQIDQLIDVMPFDRRRAMYSENSRSSTLIVPKALIA